MRSTTPIQMPFLPKPPATKQELLARLNGISVVRDSGQATVQRDGSMRHVARLSWVENDPATNQPICKSFEDSLPHPAESGEIGRLMTRLEAKFEEYKAEIVEFFFPSKEKEAPQPIIATNVTNAAGEPLPDTQTPEEHHEATAEKVEAGQPGSMHLASPADEQTLSAAPPNTDAGQGNSPIPEGAESIPIGVDAGAPTDDTAGPRAGAAKQSGSESLAGS